MKPNLLGLTACWLSAALAAPASAQIIDFESSANWSGTAAISVVGDSSQGAGAFSVSKTSGYGKIVSPSVGVVDVTDAMLQLDIKLPSAASWGQIQLFYSIASLGLTARWIGAQELAGLPAGPYVTLNFPLDATMASHLSSGAADLRFEFGFNTPASLNPILIDNLRAPGSGSSEGSVVECGPDNEYRLTIVLESPAQLTPATAGNLEQVFCQLYPQMVDRFRPTAPRAITAVIKPPYPGIYPGWYEGHIDTIFISEQHIANWPQDYDLFTHELMHAVQEDYPDHPGWLREGIADYGRNEYGLNNAAAGWALETYSYPKHFTSGYGLVARFLIWLDGEHPLSQPWADVLHADMLDGIYGPASWSGRAGFSLEQLWSDFTAASGGPAAPVPPSEGVTLYEHAGYVSDYPIVLGVGSYTFDQLRSRGAPNNWNYQPGQTAEGGLTSLRVPAGYRARLFKSTDLTGPYFEVTEDVSLLSENDVYRSVIIEQI